MSYRCSPSALSLTLLAVSVASTLLFAPPPRDPPIQGPRAEAPSTPPPSRLDQPTSQDALTAPLVPTDAERMWRHTFNEAFLHFGPRDRNGFLRWLADSGKPIPPWRPGRAAPIVCRMKDGHVRSIYAGYFGIPPWQIAATVPPKVKPWSTVIPDHSKTYKFPAGHEAEYVADMRDSRFSVTFRKGGWQSARTLEIFAAGSIPYFCDIWNSPQHGTVANLPRAVLTAVLQMDGVVIGCFPKRRLWRGFNESAFNQTLYARIAALMLDYTRESLTAPTVARYILSATSLRVVPKRVLVVWTTHPVHPGYLVPTLMMGMQRLGVTVVDYPRHELIRADADGACARRAAKAWGRGFFSFCRLNDTDNEARLRARAGDAVRGGEFDAVIYQFPHPSYLMSASDPRQPVFESTWPFFADVTNTYPKDRILFISDADLLQPMHEDTAYELLSRYGVYMRRETHGCDDDIWAVKARSQLQVPGAATLQDDTSLLSTT